MPMWALLCVCCAAVKDADTSRCAQACEGYGQERPQRAAGTGKAAGGDLDEVA